MLIATILNASFLNSGTLPASATSLTVRFSESVIGATTASNYELRRAGADGLLGNTDDPIISLSSVTISGNIATLNFAALLEDVYRITVKDTITDAAGNTLDGDSNGSAGGNWRKDFVVGALTTSLTSPNGFVFDPEFGGLGAGQLVNGASSVFDGLGRLLIDGQNFIPPSTISSATTEAAVVFGPTSSDFFGTGVIPGFSRTFTVTDTADRYSVFADLVINASSSGTAQVAIVVDGVQTSVRSFTTLAGEFIRASISDLITFSSTGSHTIAIHKLGGDFVDASGNTNTLRITRLESSSPGISSATTEAAVVFGPTSSDFFGTGVIPGFSRTFTVTDTADRYSVFADLVINASSSGTAQVAIVVDGVQTSVRSFTTLGGEFIRASISDLITFSSTGSHTIAIHKLGGDFVDASGNTNTLRITRLESSSPGISSATTEAAVVFGPTSSDFFGTGVIPGFSRTFTVTDTADRYSVAADLVINASSSGTAQVAIVVDGVQTSVRSFTTLAGEFIRASISDLITFSSTGSHTIAIHKLGGDFVDASGNTNTLRVTRLESSMASSLVDGGATNWSASTQLSSVQIARASSVPPNGVQNFARTVDRFDNSSGAAITASVRIVGNLGSDAATTVFATSDGDLTVEPTDLWFGTDDADGTGTPAIIHLLHGPFGLQPTSVNVVEDNVEWTYNLTVPAGATRRLAHFTVLGTTRAEAIAAANTLVTTNGFGGQAAAFLTAGELSSLANFQFNTVPTDLATSQSSVAENLPTGSTVGTLTTVDANVGDQFVYSLVSGTGDTDNSSFTIDAGLLKTNAVFNYEAKNSYSIRVRSTDLGGLSVEKQLTITIENALERTAPVQIGDGTVQRSVVNKLVIPFDHAIEFDAGAFQVFQRVKDSNNSLVLVPVTTNVTLAATAGGMTATLTFSGALTRTGTNALVDGNYQLTINGGLIRILNTTKTFDADGDGNGGGLYRLGTQSTDNFFALLGDANGNGEVDAQDLLGAKLALRKTVGQAGYNIAYDINGNGVVDAQDILNIQLNLRKKRVFF